MDWSGGGVASTTDSSVGGAGTTDTSGMVSPNVVLDQQGPPAQGSPSGTATPNMAGSGSQVTPGGQVAPAAPSWFSQAGDFLSGSGVSGLTKNISPLIAGGGIINSVLQGNKAIPQKGNLENIAGQQQATGTQLMNSALQGNLPPGIESGLDAQLQQQINQIQADYASKGLSGSTMETQAIQSAQNQFQANKAQLLNQYLTEGSNMEGMATTDLQNLSNAQLSQSQGMSASIAKFLQAMTGGGGSNNNSTSVQGS